MTILLNLLIITNIVCFIVDLSGIIDSIKYGIWKTFIKVGDYHNLNLKPFSCSLCMSFWCGLIYLLITHSFTIPYIGFVCLMSLLAGTFSSIQQLIRDIIQKLITLIDNLL